MSINTPTVIYIMGVSGTGKTAIGTLLAKELGIPFFDGDDYHPETNIKKMASGIPLTDEDRWDWLARLNELAISKLENNSCVIACSSLKESYRNILRKNIKNYTFVFLEGTEEQIELRMKSRTSHFMPESLLKSQFDVLEKPVALTQDISLTPSEIVANIKSELFEKSEFGIIGLGVMGKSLCRNMARNGIRISMYNRHVDGTEVKVAENFQQQYTELEKALPFDHLKEFVASLQTPKRILLMVNAGKTVDLVLQELLPLLTDNDVIIDGGNSHFEDTAQRIKRLQKEGIHFIGCGVSGGEEGALKGPSIMPGGTISAYNYIKPYLEKIAAKDNEGKPCCAYIGKEGSGHYVKMVHNGMEYAEMQLLAEVYSILTKSGKNPNEIAELLRDWKVDADSFLLDITIQILKYKENDTWLIDRILDKAGNKGTGNWTTVEMARIGIPATMISTALFARYISAFKEERILMEKLYGRTDSSITIDSGELKKAYQVARIINHHQGFKMLAEASKIYGWKLNLSEIARIWTNGCIIRSSLMEELVIFLKETDTLLMHTDIRSKVLAFKSALTHTVADCIRNQIPVPCFSEAINYLNASTESISSAHIIQAQRDYFGAHTYQRNDDPTLRSYHTNWKN